VGLFNDNPEMIRLNPVFYLKGNNYLLESLFFLNYSSQFKEVLSKLEEEIDRGTIPQNDNLLSLSFLYLNAHKLNQYFMDGAFKQALYLVDEINEGIKMHKERIDQHHIMVLHYKIASLYFGVGDYKNSIHYLKTIINNKTLKMREDLMCFARLLSLVAHYEAGLDYHLEVQLKSTYKFLLKMNDLKAVQKEIIKFLRKLGDIYPGELKAAFKELYDDLKIYENHPYEKRAFLYLDILSWLKSHLENKAIADVISEKSQAINR
jgi:tetratricopeptide (TPR) repeat protein